MSEVAQRFVCLMRRLTNFFLSSYLITYLARWMGRGRKGGRNSCNNSNGNNVKYTNNFLCHAVIKVKPHKVIETESERGGQVEKRKKSNKSITKAAYNKRCL